MPIPVRVLAKSALLLTLVPSVTSAAPAAVAFQASRVGEKLTLLDLFSTATYGLLGIALSVLGYLVFDLITPFSLGKELVEDKNVAVGIVVAGIIIGISIIIASAVS
ncbi:MAG: DUF350 domain-containing protein [Acidobacteria bacterium]|nr:DUF350 domain-containing protein [Acidobacteriota bacterium]